MTTFIAAKKILSKLLSSLDGEVQYVNGVVSHARAEKHMCRNESIIQNLLAPSTELLFTCIRVVEHMKANFFFVSCTYRIIPMRCQHAVR